jgi:hypothetical protein
MTTTSTIPATAARLLVALLVTISIVIATPAHAADGDLQAPLKPEEPPLPQPKVELTVNVHCFGFTYGIDLKHGPAGEKTYRFQYREPGSPQHTQLGNHAATGGLFFIDAFDDIEVRGVVHLVNDPTSFYSDWILIPAPDCDDGPHPEDEPGGEDQPDLEDEPDPEDEPSGEGGSGPDVVGSDIVQATPTFTG